MRKCGVLLPISSLSSPFGIGSLGRCAYEFVDFLAEAGQSLWQVLPLGPTGYGDSPYQNFSAFACNPYFIDLQLLFEKGWLTEGEVEGAKKENRDGTIDYNALFRYRFPLLKKAAARTNYGQKLEGYEQFKAEQTNWLTEYALFMAIKSENGHTSFREWPRELRRREEVALVQARQRLSEEMNERMVIQFFFYEQWMDLKRYANERGIQIIGDIPIYVSQDSVEMWSEPELFQTNEEGESEVVAGCPPDHFSKKGQLWGNPVYDWEYAKGTGYQWWIRRLKQAFYLYDVVRIDHFRGFSGYYAVSAGAEDASEGIWREGPGIPFIEAVKRELPSAEIIAEDLGFLTEDVRELLAFSGFPGMKVLQFAFDSGEESDYLPHNYLQNSVVYTGTHDNTTTAEWAETATSREVSFAKEYLNVGEGQNLAQCMLNAALASVCDTAMIPIQDWLHLGAQARMNIPSTVGENWKWRLEAGMLTRELAARMYRLTSIYGRLA